MAGRVFGAIIHEEDDLYGAECPEIGGVGRGTAIEEAIANLKVATELSLEESSVPETTQSLLTQLRSAMPRLSRSFSKSEPPFRSIM